MKLTVDEQARLDAHRLSGFATVVGALSLLGKPKGTTKTPTADEPSSLVVPGRVQSRINLMNGSKAEGWEHVLDQHYNPLRNKSQFSIPQDELRQILQSEQVVKTPISRILESTGGPRYVRELVLGRDVGTDKFSGYATTRTISILTDRFGNLISATPGSIK